MLYFKMQSSDICILVKPMKFLFVVVGLARLAGHIVRGSGRGKRPSLSLPFALNSHGSFSPRPRCLSH